MSHLFKTELQGNMDKFEKVAAELGWHSTRNRGSEGWNQYVEFFGLDGRRYGVHFHLDHFVVKGLATLDFEKYNCYLGQDAGRLSDTTSRMSASKSVDQLVKEVQRRVITPYETFFEIMQKLIIQSRDYVLRTNEHAQLIGGILGAKVEGAYDGGARSKVEDVHLTKHFPEGVTLNVRFCSNSVRWEYVSIPNDLHEKLCRVIADHFSHEVKK
jgi:hypothetical protein